MAKEANGQTGEEFGFAGAGSSATQVNENSGQDDAVENEVVPGSADGGENGAADGAAAAGEEDVDLIAGKWRSVDELVLEAGRMEQENKNLREQSARAAQTGQQRQPDARTAAYQSAETEMRQLVEDIGTTISPDAAHKLTRLMDLNTQLRVGPIMEQVFQDRNAREYEGIRQTFKNHEQLAPMVQQIISQGRASNLPDAFRLANYENLEKIARGEADGQDRKSVDKEKLGAFTKSGSGATGAKSKPITSNDMADILYTRLKNRGRHEGSEKAASLLGF